MLVTIFGIEIVMIKKNFSFYSKDQENIYINTLFLNGEHA